MSDSPRYIDVDRLMQDVSIEQVTAYYGVALPELQRRGDEIRSKCFLACGFPEATGNRALAINDADPAKKWKCHQYGCDKGGNLISLCDLLKSGGNAGGRPRGERFKEIARDLLAMTGHSPADGPSSSAPLKQVEPHRTSTEGELARTIANKEPMANPPLAKSAIEKARALVNLDEKFVRDVAAMPPAAARYVRSRPFLSSEVQTKWRMGYLPRGGAGTDQSGGTMRGRLVYPILSERGEVLTWFGRDPEFEEKHEAWVAGGKRDRDPEKFHFVKGFHRGLELFGQQWSRLKEPGFRESLEELGLIVVEGPNDVIRLDTLGAPAVGLCSNLATTEQLAKIARFAKRVAANRVTLMLDGDEAGQAGTKQVLFELAKRGSNVRVAVIAEEPEHLAVEEWEEIRSSLQQRKQ